MRALPPFCAGLSAAVLCAFFGIAPFVVEIFVCGVLSFAAAFMERGDF